MIALAHQPPGTRKGRRAAAARPATGRGPRLTGRTRRNLKSPRRRRVREISRWSLLLGRLMLVRASPSGRDPECHESKLPGSSGPGGCRFQVYCRAKGVQDQSVFFVLPDAVSLIRQLSGRGVLVREPRSGPGGCRRAADAAATTVTRIRPRLDKGRNVVRE